MELIAGLMMLGSITTAFVFMAKAIRLNAECTRIELHTLKVLDNTLNK